MKRIAAALLAFSSSFAPIPTAFADTLVDNVDGLTVDADGRIERFNGLLIGDDGRIEQVLARTDRRPGKVDYLIDGKGRVLMPGFVDSHVQLMELGLSTLMLDLSPARSLAEAQARIAAWAAAHPDKPWILGRGWNHDAWGLGRFPTAAEIDFVVKDRPVWLVDAEGDAGWANSAALAAAGVTAATKEPAGGRIERAAGTLKPAGVLTGAAAGLVAKAVPAPRPEDCDLAFAAAQQLLLQRGITAVADMGTTIEDWQAYRRAGDNASLRIRIMAYADGIDAMTLIGGPGPSPWLYEDRLRLNGVLLRVDGTLASRGAVLKAPYADKPAGSGQSRLGDIQLRNLMSRAAMDNFQVAVRADGDRAVASVLAAIDELAATYSGERRWRAEGAQTIDPADLPGFGKHGIVASMQPSRLQRDKDLAEARLGPGRLGRIHAWHSVAAAGAMLAFGSDTPSRSPDPFADLAEAITRQGTDGLPFGGWQPQEKLTRESALAAYTANGARAGFAEGKFGRLAPGQKADFLLVDRDPTLASPAELRATVVSQVWIGGRLAWSRPENQGLSGLD